MCLVGLLGFGEEKHISATFSSSSFLQLNIYFVSSKRFGPQPHKAEKKMLAHHLLAENKQIKDFTAIFLKSKNKRCKNLRKI